MMNNALRNWVLLALVGLAYLLRGAKTGPAFAVLFILAGALFLTANHKWPARSIPMALFWPFLAYLAWSWTGLIAGAPLDIFLFRFCHICLYVLVGLIFFQFSDESTLKRFEELLLALGGVEAFLILLARMTGGYPQNSGYLHNPIYSTLLLTIAFGVALARVHNRSADKPRIFGFLIAALVMAAAVLAARSRIGIISMAAILFYIYPRKSPWIAAVLAVILIGWWRLSGNAFLLHLKMDTLGFQLSMGRLSIWTTAIDAIVSRPLWGVGLGNFEKAYLEFQNPSGLFLAYGNSTIFAHNGFLQQAVETGLPGAILFFGGLFAVLKRGTALFFKEYSLFCILIVFFISSLFNFSLFLSFSGLVFAVAIGILAAKGNLADVRQYDALSPRHTVLPTFLIVVLSLFLTSYGISEALQKSGDTKLAARVCPIRSEAWYELALDDLRKSKDALPALHRALVWNPQNSFYWQRKALILANCLPAEQGEIERCFRYAQALSPFHAPFYVEEGFYRFQNRALNSAQQLFEKATALEPAAPVPQYGLALIAAQRGDGKSAKSRIELVRSLKRRQLELERDPLYGSFYRQIFSFPYGQFLFNVNENQLTTLEHQIDET